jgi:hypothetical protein
MTLLERGNEKEGAPGETPSFARWEKKLSIGRCELQYALFTVITAGCGE